MSARDDVIDEVYAECRAQDQKWDEQNHPDGTGGRLAQAKAHAARLRCDIAAREDKSTWRLILDEEVAEAYAETDPAKLRDELIQVAAVAVQWVAAIDRRQWFACTQCGGPRMRVQAWTLSSPNVTDIPGFCEAGCDRPKKAA